MARLHGFTDFCKNIPDHTRRWMDGSLFFRAVAWLLDFFRRLCAGSFIVGACTADFEDESVTRSRFVRAAEYILNRFPRLSPAQFWPKWLSGILSGSVLIRSACDALDTPIPPGADGRVPFWHGGIVPVLQWFAMAAPAWGVLAVLVGAPFLPTMLLAGMLVAVAGFTLFTHRFAVDLTGAFVLLFILVTLFAGFASFMPSSSLSIALLTSVLMFSCLLVPACCHRRSQIDFLFFAFVASAAGAGLIGFYQFITKQVDMTWVDVDLFGDIQFRAYSSFGNPNVYGTYLLLAVPLCAGLFFYARKPLSKLFALGVTGLLLLNLLLTYSRGCMLALALAALVFVLLTEKRLVALLPVAAIALFFVLPDTIISRLQSITNTSDSSTSYRLFIWQGTLRILKDFWMAGLGQGIDAYNVVYPFYAFNAIIAPHSHNLFLQVFVETGIVGLLVFLGVLAGFFRTMARCHRHAKEPRDKILAAALIAATVGFLFQGIFDYVFYNYRVMLVFFLFMGLSCAFAKQATRAVRADDAHAGVINGNRFGKRNDGVAP